AMNPQSRVLTLRFDPATGALAQGYIRSLLANLQFVTPGVGVRDPDAWTSEESDPSGRYVAAYQVVARDSAPSIAEEIWTITKSKCRYLQPDSSTAGTRSVVLPVLEPSGVRTARFDVRRGLLLSLDGTERQITRMNDQTVGDGESKVSTNFAGMETLARAEIDMVRQRFV